MHICLQREPNVYVPPFFCPRLSTRHEIKNMGEERKREKKVRPWMCWGEERTKGDQEGWNIDTNHGSECWYSLFLALGALLALLAAALCNQNHFLDAQLPFQGVFAQSTQPRSTGRYRSRSRRCRSSGEMSGDQCTLEARSERVTSSYDLAFAQFLGRQILFFSRRTTTTTGAVHSCGRRA